MGKTVLKFDLQLLQKQKGKSGGSRIITDFIVSDKTIYLLSIYDKSEKENITDKELNELLEYIPE